MPNLKEIRTRIGSVKKTRQITSAMKLVAAAKLRGASDRATAAQPYQERLRDVLRRVSAAAGGSVEDPLLRNPERTHNVLMVILTSDRGLCGGFNNNLMRRALPWVEERRAQGQAVEIRVFGRKGRDFARARKVELADTVLDYAKVPKMDLVRPLSNVMVGGFVEERYDEVWLAYNDFVNAATQNPAFHKVMPLSVEAVGEEQAEASSDYLFEPGPQELLSTLLPLYLRTLVLQAFLETEAGEHGARMLAMDNATRNAGELIEGLTLVYNRARQAAITTEITEIVSGAEAL